MLKRKHIAKIEPKPINDDDDNFGNPEADGAYWHEYNEARMFRGESHEEAEKAAKDAREYAIRLMTEGTKENLEMKRQVEQNSREGRVDPWD